MKQHITEKQWDELNYKQQDVLRKMFPKALTIDIRQMIEFLGDDLEKIDNDNGEWRLWCGKDTDNLTSGNNLCDLLWGAIKDKLNYEKCNRTIN